MARSFCWDNVSVSEYGCIGVSERYGKLKVKSEKLNLTPKTEGNARLIIIISVFIVTAILYYSEAFALQRASAFYYGDSV
jgi:hypothetical protein